jgi:hypothetical protein
MAMNKVGGQAFNSKGKVATARSLNAANSQSGIQGNKQAQRSATSKQEGGQKAKHTSKAKNRRKNKNGNNSKKEGEGQK